MARQPREDTGVRKNLRLTQASETRIQRVKQAADLTSDAEVIRTVLREYVKIMDLQMKGAQFFYRTADTSQEIPLDPFYETERETALA